MDQRYNFVTSVSLGPRVIEKFVDARHHRAALRCSHDSNAPTTSEVEQALVAKDVKSANDRVLVHLKNRRQVYCRRQTLTLKRFAFGDGPTDLRGHLFVEGNRVVLVNFRRLHSTILNSTIESVVSREIKMTMTPIRGTSPQTLPDPSELLIKEARQQMLRRRLRFVVAVLIVLVAAVAVWQGSGGTTHPASPPRVNTSGPQRGLPGGSSNLAALGVLGGQSLAQVVPFGLKTVWVSTANNVKSTGGGQGIELTTNAGKSWKNVTPPGLGVGGGTHSIHGFFALSPTRAWLLYGGIKGPQTIETTSDAGHHWSSKAGVLSPTGCTPQFVTLQDGTCSQLWGAGGSMPVGIYRTADGGASWHKILQSGIGATSTTPGSIPFGCDKNIDFTSTTKGFVLFWCNGGTGAIIYGTTNGGVTWAARNVTQPTMPLGGGGFTGSPVFIGLKGAVPYGGGSYSAVFVTTDGGQSFHPVYPPDKPRQWSVDIISPSQWRLTYGKEILATNNGGTSWFSVTSNTMLTNTRFVKGAPPGGLVRFVSANDGWLTVNQYNSNPSLLRTNNGGRTWRTVSVPGTEKL